MKKANISLIVIKDALWDFGTGFNYMKDGMGSWGGMERAIEFMERWDALFWELADWMLEIKYASMADLGILEKKAKLLRSAIANADNYRIAVDGGTVKLHP